jgi:hypothetical protein
MLAEGIKRGRDIKIKPWLKRSWIGRASQIRMTPVSYIESVEIAQLAPVVLLRNYLKMAFL